jgi:hypothetical protein
MDVWRGGLAQKPFALGLTAVYLTGIAAHALLSGEVMARAGVWPFIVVQAVLIALWLVLHIRRLRDAGQGPTAAIGVALVYVLSLALLLIGGMVDNVSVVIRSTLLTLRTPQHLLGRVSAVNQIFIGSSNEIGSFESGVAAKLLGTVRSVVFGGIVTLGVVGVTAWRIPALRKLDELD